MIDFEPNEEQQLIIDTVRQFAENELRPVARECDEGGKIPDAVLAQAHELGLVANGLPEEYGGGGSPSAVTGALIAEELAWGDLSLGLAILSPALAALPIAQLGNPAQKQELLPRYSAESFRPGSLAFVEPQFDRDVFHPKTVARREGDEIVLDGEKCLVPWLDGDDLVLVSASEGDRPQIFVVSRNASGLTATPEHYMGIQALPTVGLKLEGVRVSSSSRLGSETEDSLRRIVDRGRVGLAAMAVGVARAAFEIARDYAKERHAFGAPIATKQAIAFKLADMAIEVDGTRLLVWEAAWKLDRGEDATREATLAHHQAQRVALAVADGAVQVLGGHGYIRDYLPEMHLRNARGFCAFESLTLI